MDKKYKAVEGGSMSTKYDPRYIIIDTESGEIVDDAQGYGYKTIQKAYAAFSYKNRSKEEKKEYTKQQEKIRKWEKNHKSFFKALDQYAFEIAKGSWGPGDKVNTTLVKEMLKEYPETEQPPCTAYELLKYWRKR